MCLGHKAPCEYKSIKSFVLKQIEIEPQAFYVLIALMWQTKNKPKYENEMQTHFYDQLDQSNLHMPIYCYCLDVCTLSFNHCNVAIIFEVLNYPN